MLLRLRSRLSCQDGFTLIELLVVVLIIGILAAIAIPSFLNQRGKGEDASAKSGVKTAQTAFETYSSENGDYNCGTAAECDAALRAIESQLPAAGDLTLVGGATTYRITVRSNPSGRAFSLDKGAGGAVTRTCTVPPDTDRGGCGDDGRW